MVLIGSKQSEKRYNLRIPITQGEYSNDFCRQTDTTSQKAGWSQEELAEQMNVTRQSVSKWEGAQSVPDLKKIIRLSELFGVSTDYLLKDEIEDTECNIQSDDLSTLRRVSMEEANAFLSVKATTSKTIAFATFLCILSPICLLILGAISETPEYGLADNVAGGIGMIVLLLLLQ